ncbi:MAG: 23S rRNA (guanosine(2251)-2'-O)-methyltransferase RlmB [Deltaproteobacteria bacterium]|nr:23S rRNA (guanosine(2251)-2'-O)-methyltransferase RlmB [Deltaproteobacteria bacterium]
MKKHLPTGSLLYGIHPVHEALVAGRRRFKALYVSKSRTSKRIEPILERARGRGIPVHVREADYFKTRLGDAVHQGVFAQVGGLPLVDHYGVLKRAGERGEPPLILALDNVVDPQNLGSLVRTALAMGVHGIVFPKARAAPLSPAVSKASAGAMEHMLFTRVTNLVAALKGFKKTGLWVVGAHPASKTTVDEADFNVGLVVVIGGEGKGIRPLVQKTCDYLVSIPQKRDVDSLNAAVAGAIVMYEIARQRTESTQISVVSQSAGDEAPSNKDG